MASPAKPRAPLSPLAEDDSVLVERTRRGDERAFAQLYRRHARYLAGVVFRLMGDEMELDDVVQESFLALRDRIDELREPDRVRFWLVKVAVRGAHKRLSRRRRRWALLSAQPPPPTATDPAASEELRELHDALSSLPPKLRVPWTLHALEGETLPEVAELCGVSLATVKRRIKDARERLERRLGDV